MKVAIDPTLPAGDIPPATRSPVQDEMVLTSSLRLVYLALSILVLGAVVLFAGWWFTMVDRWSRPLAYTVTSVIFICELGIWSARWGVLGRMRRPRHLAPAQELRVAVVTTIVPGREPLAMLEQSLAAMIALRYPHDTWVLDEGDDPLVRELCARLGANHSTRKDRPEYQTNGGRFGARTKHGNYNAWLTESGMGRYDILVPFDTDHAPEPDYLERTLGYFRDPQVAYVQPPQVYYNQEASFIACGAAEESYAYYSSHQMASYAMGHPIVIGSHGLHRLGVLDSVGGFPDHDAEDLYLTMLYRAAGWRGVYVPEILALGTTPVDWRGYLVQQMRWARAVLDLKRTTLRSAAGSLPIRDRVLSLFHGAYFLRPLLWILLFPMFIGLLANNAVPIFFRPRALLIFVSMASVLHLADRFRQAFYLDPRREGGIHWRAALLQYAKWPHFAGALLDTLIGRDVPYALTPKVGGGTRRYILAPLHLGLCATVAVAWLVGWVYHGPIAPVLTLLAVLVGGASLALAWSETRSYPAPFDPALLPARRALLGEILAARRD